MLTFQGITLINNNQSLLEKSLLRIRKFTGFIFMETMGILTPKDFYRYKARI